LPDTGPADVHVGKKRIQNVITGNVIICLLLAPLVLMPLARKWELDLRRVSIGGLAIALFAGIALSWVTMLHPLELPTRIIAGGAMILFLAVVMLLARFYRDPERSVPVLNNIIVAPADGVIKYIKKIEPDKETLSSKGSENIGLAPQFIDILPEGRGYLIGIAMNFLDVHVTRAPIKGEVVYMEHVPGSFISPKRPGATGRNERMHQVIRDHGYSIGLIHIASRLVRQIVSFVDVGDRLLPGQRLGMIRFGSQVDIILPDRGDLGIMAETGDRIVAGETIIALLKGD